MLLPLLRKSQAPRILNVSSTMGSIAFAASTAMIVGRCVAYRMSKAALNSLSAIQSAEYNEAAVAAQAAGQPVPHPLITVLTICPGAVDTDMSRVYLKGEVQRAPVRAAAYEAMFMPIASLPAPSAGQWGGG